MPKKLTEEEQRAAIRLAKALAAALPAQHRSRASGIASGLVRLRAERIPAGKVQEVFNRYGAGRDALDAITAAGLLIGIEEDAYAIRIDGEPLLPRGEKNGGANADNGAASGGHADAGNGGSAGVGGSNGSAGQKQKDRGGDCAQAHAGEKNAAAAGKDAAASGQAAAGARTGSTGSSPATTAPQTAAPAARPATGASRPGADSAAHGPARASLPAAGVAGSSRTGEPAAKDGSSRPAKQATPHAQPAAADMPPRAPRPKPRPIGRASVIRKQTPELTDIRRRIIDLDPRLWINGYLLSTPDVFVDYEPELNALSAAMDRRPAIGDGTLTMRELSYRIFGDEKFLAIESEGRKLLRLMGLTDMVRCRTVHKTDLMHFIPRHRRKPRLVLSENLDPWTNMRDALFLGERKRILGKRVDGVVFGNGHLALGSHQLRDLVSTLGAEEVRLYYWGDLDRAGLEILAKVAQEAPADSPVPLTVEPFAPAYRLMLKRVMKRFPDPLDNKGTDQAEDFEPGFALLEPLLKKKEAAYLRAALEGRRLIPQEIVTAADL